jgi:hypothetical protein
MPWHWTDHITRKVRDTIVAELVGGEVQIKGSGASAPLATIPLSGKTETVVGTAVSKGRAVTVSVTNAAGVMVGAVPAPEVCDRVELEPGAQVTVTLRLG